MLTAPFIRLRRVRRDFFQIHSDDIYAANAAPQVHPCVGRQDHREGENRL
jgi:hypothetical protein